jgi:hypothetical protein
MGTFLFKAAALLVLQSPQQSLWTRVAADSTDASAWLELGTAYLQRAAEYHQHKQPMTVDTVWAHATLDTAQSAFERAARFSAGTRTADSARVYRIYAFGEMAYVDWEAAGSTAAMLTWHTLPESLRLPSVLEELGENLLRACPHQGVLFTTGDIDTQAAWYLRFSRNLRPDLLIVPFDRWRGDSVLRNRALKELKTRDPSLRALSQTRAVCASMGFERPPDERTVKWNKRPLVWVMGKETKGDRVSPQDFVFAALKQAVDEHETWTAPVTAIYRRAVANSSGLCKAFDAFELGAEVGCR